MKCNTREEKFFGVGSLYARFCELRDKRKPKGLRYRLETILVIMILAKLRGEENPSAIAEWAKHRSELLREGLKLERNTMPHHSTYFLFRLISTFCHRTGKWSQEISAPLYRLRLALSRLWLLFRPHSLPFLTSE